jgi:hypothetical protein
MQVAATSATTTSTYLAECAMRFVFNGVSDAA